jgi:hypothetical protein
MENVIKAMLMILVIMSTTGCSEGSVAEQQNENQLSQYSDNNIIEEPGVNAEVNSDEISGIVLNFNADGMSIEKAEVTQLEASDDQIMVTGADENETMNIFFNEATSFQIHKINVDGINAEISQGSIQDLFPSVSVTVIGKYQNEIFIADQVQIWVNES